MEVNTGSYRKMRNGNGKIPWKMILTVVSMLAATVGGGWSVWDAIADVKADSAKARDIQHERVITPLQDTVKGHADSIANLETAVGVITTKVGYIEGHVADLKKDIEGRMDRQEDMQGEILEMLRTAINGDSSNGKP